jgi:DMSO reductase family type II enzyme chaperone
MCALTNMPTPFDQSQEVAGSGEWAARHETPKRSIFGNYPARPLALADATLDSDDHSVPHTPASGNPAALRLDIDVAVTRSYVYRFLAAAYGDPTPTGWNWLTSEDTVAAMRSATQTLGEPLAVAAQTFISTLGSAGFELFLNAYLAAFGHAARGSCPLNEIEYGDIKADPLFQPHRLADLAAFYRAFGLEVAEDAGERQDHICLELEFMCVLAAKEGYALDKQLDAAQLGQCHEAEAKFLREHLGRWTPAFSRRLAAATHEPALTALAAFTRAFIESDCARFEVGSGSEDLLLRPVDEAAERMCDGCGIVNLPPGAATTT